MMLQFPADPSNNTIFEAQPGVLYIYEAATDSWVKVVGNQTFPLATPISDGLMAATDLVKLNQLIIPAPISTITAENCQTRFVAGNINLYSTDGLINISGQVTIGQTTKRWKLAPNTAVFDFTIDKTTLFAQLAANRQLNYLGITGPIGPKGPTGDPGDILVTGPKGPTGDPGQIPPCTVSINQDILSYEAQSGITKAIIGIEAQSLNETDYQIILKRGIIGNPQAAPDKLKVNCDQQSTWVLGVVNTGGPPAACCTSDADRFQLYYIDIFPILAAISDKFDSEVIRLKHGEERIVQFWLQKMQQLYNTQKAAICCALQAATQTLASRATPQQITPLPLPVYIQGTTGIQGLDVGRGIIATPPTMIMGIKPNATPKTEYRLTSVDIKEHEYAWQSRNCHGVIMRLFNQDFIIMGYKGQDQALAKTAIAWPTLDDYHFALAHDITNIGVQHNEQLNKIIATKLSTNDFRKSCGGNVTNKLDNVITTRDFSDQLSVVLFPLMK